MASQVAPVPPLADLMPREVFQKSTTKAIWSLIKILSFVTLGVVIIANTPWYLLPIGWLFLGTSVTGLLTVAYACSNDAFFENNTVNDIVGTLCLLPLMTPFQSWRQYFNKSSKQ
jgi:fatty acid desaturase